MLFGRKKNSDNHGRYSYTFVFQYLTPDQLDEHREWSERLRCKANATGHVRLVLSCPIIGRKVGQFDVTGKSQAEISALVNNYEAEAEAYDDMVLAQKLAARDAGQEWLSKITVVNQDETERELVAYLTSCGHSGEAIRWFVEIWKDRLSSNADADKDIDDPTEDLFDDSLDVDDEDAESDDEEMEGDDEEMEDDEDDEDEDDVMMDEDDEEGDDEDEQDEEGDDDIDDSEYVPHQSLKVNLTKLIACDSLAAFMQAGGIVVNSPEASIEQNENADLAYAIAHQLFLNKANDQGEYGRETVDGSTEIVVGEAPWPHDREAPGDAFVFVVDYFRSDAALDTTVFTSYGQNESRHADGTMNHILLSSGSVRNLFPVKDSDEPKDNPGFGRRPYSHRFPNPIQANVVFRDLAGAETETPPTDWEMFGQSYLIWRLNRHELFCSGDAEGSLEDVRFIDPKLPGNYNLW
jgi:hypothetical protein